MRVFIFGRTDLRIVQKTSQAVVQAETQSQVSDICVPSYRNFTTLAWYVINSSYLVIYEP